MTKNVLDLGQQMDLVKWLRKEDRVGTLEGKTHLEAAVLANEAMEFSVTMPNIRSVLPHANIKWGGRHVTGGKTKALIQDLEKRIAFLESLHTGIDLINHSPAGDKHEKDA